ncbi:MAG: hypothetical protein AAF609_24065 [Cyanobacteria bacterium P01_C01_bin.120]
MASSSWLRKNPKIQAYLSPHIYRKLIAFQQAHDLSSISKTVEQIFEALLFDDDLLAQLEEKWGFEDQSTRAEEEAGSEVNIESAAVEPEQVMNLADEFDILTESQESEVYPDGEQDDSTEAEHRLERRMARMENEVRDVKAQLSILIGDRLNQPNYYVDGSRYLTMVSKIYLDAYHLKSGLHGARLKVKRLTPRDSEERKEITDPEEGVSQRKLDFDKNSHHHRSQLSLDMGQPLLPDANPQAQRPNLAGEERGRFRNRRLPGQLPPE